MLSRSERIHNNPARRTKCCSGAAKQQDAINKTNNKRIPVPDPGVPALPETDTSTPSPSIGHQWTICLCAGLHNSPSPYINKLTGHVSIQSSNNKTYIKKVDSKESLWRNA
ncbi:hypothetical protein ACLKA6_018671 [Drosophila palustris]